MLDDEIAVGDLRFRARVDGPEDGPLVLLLHGFPQSSWEWHEQLPALARAGYRAVAPDQRGYSPGARPAGIEAYAIEHLVADVLGMADALGVERFHLVGHDWGAIVAWHVAAWHPDRLRSLTPVSVPHLDAFARALADPSSSQAERSSYILGFKEPEATDLFTADALQHAFDASGLAGHDVAPHIEVLGDRDAMDAALNWYRAFDFHGGSLGPVRVPTLFVWSTDDVAIAQEGAGWTAEHVEAPYRFEVLDGVVHWIPEVAPERLNELLLWQLAAHAD